MQISKVGRQSISQGSARRQVLLLSVVLFLALSPVSSTRVNAQIPCLNNCEQQFAQCLGSGTNKDTFAPSCLDTYEACVDACLGSFAGLLG